MVPCSRRAARSARSDRVAILTTGGAIYGPGAVAPYGSRPTSRPASRAGRRAPAGRPASAPTATATAAHRQPCGPTASAASSGRKISWPVAPAAVSTPTTRPRRSTNHRVATVAANASRPSSRCRSRRRRPSRHQLPREAVITVVSAEPAATRPRAAEHHPPHPEAHHRRRRERRRASPKSSRFTETASGDRRRAPSRTRPPAARSARLASTGNRPRRADHDERDRGDHPGEVRQKKKKKKKKKKTRVISGTPGRCSSRSRPPCRRGW